MDELTRLNAGTMQARLTAAQEIAKTAQFPRPQYDDVNGHIHTTYSFSPYSPAAAVWKAKMSGLKTAGIMDHDSIGGAREFIRAGEIFDMLVTVGLECRVSLAGTPYEKTRINNPDQVGCAYATIHGVPHDQIETLNDAFAPLRARRNVRNAKMVENINRNFAPYGIAVDFEKDVLAISQYADGGTVTERHISSALAQKVIDARGGRGSRVIGFLKDQLGVTPSEKIQGFLADPENPHYLYDLIGVIKSDIITGFYVPATDELMPIADLCALAKRIGAVACIPYLGDVGASVTGDKRAQKFEDDYLEDWVAFVKSLGFDAITYMPSRNTPQQLARLRAVIAANGLWEISGEDINTSRQQFVCASMRDAYFDALRTSAYALIAHERRAQENKADGMFGANSIARYPDLAARAEAFADMVR